MGVFRFIWRSLDSYRIRFIAVCVASAVHGAAAFMVPVVLADATRNPLPTNRVLPTVAIIVGLYVVDLALCRYVRGPGEALASQFGNHLRLKYFARIDGQPVDRLTRQHSGYTLSLVGKVADGMQPILFEVFWNLAPGAVVIVMFFYFTTAVSPLIGLANLVLLAGFVAISAVLSRRMVPLSAELNERRAGLLEGYVDFTANILTVKKLGIFGFAASRLNRETASNFEQIRRVQRFHGNRWLALHSLFGLIYLGTLAFMLWRVADGALAVSLLILFVGAYSRVRGLIEGLSETVKAFMEMRAYIATLEDQLVDVSTAAGAAPAAWSEIRLDGVTFDYGGDGPRITVPFLRLLPGDKVCVIGESGQGKTTLLGLLAGHLDADGGRQEVDGTPYSQLGRAFFDEHVALVSQEVDLFNLSLRENLTLDRAVEDADVLTLLGEVGLADWANSLPAGLDTVVGEKGTRLSAGQKQRVNLVRGLLLDRDVCILDEPTAHLDEATEAEVVEFIRHRFADRTLVIVTHRPALQGLCARTYAMADHRLSPVRPEAAVT